MEKAILKTLVYADLFDYPLLAQEIHKWLIGRQSSIEQVDKILIRLVKNKKIGFKKGVYFLKNRSKLADIRHEREVISQKYYQKAVWVARLFKIVPWIQLVGISGSLALRNADKKADIDLFVITRRKRVWLSRLLSAFILELLGVRRAREASVTESAGKICLNLLISEDAMLQSTHNLYIAHEVLQMKVLWERQKTYQRFLEANEWAFEFLPNWIGMTAVEKKIGKGIKKQWRFFDWLEYLVEVLQRRYMGRVLREEKVGHQMAYFHPDDAGEWVMREYSKKIIKYKVL